MMKRTFTRIVLLVLIGLGYAVTDGNAQDLSPWTDSPYGNEWIDYSKKYVRVGVTANGIYKVPFGALSTSLKKGSETITPAQIQLWHRGKEVAIISADNNWVVFYGEKNDGASDGLMFRPGPEARLNPYVSFYSDRGIYFFTTSGNPNRADSHDAKPSGDIEPEPDHLKKVVYTFTNQFSFLSNGVGSQLNNSYYDEANSYTGAYIYGPNARDFNVPNLTPKFRDFDIDLPKWNSASPVKPRLEVLVNALHDGAHDVQVMVGTTTDVVNLKTVGAIPFFGFGGRKITSNLNSGDHVTAAGKGKMRISSTSTSASDWFALTYYSVSYPQLTDMSGVSLMEFNFPVTVNPVRRISLKNCPETSVIYDISNPLVPVIMANGDRNGLTVNLDVPSISNRKLTLLASTIINEITSANLVVVDFNPLLELTNVVNPHLANGAINPSAFDYLVITHDLLKEAAKTYVSSYRGISEGGSHRSLVVDISKIYNEFNYGEPSPLAIRRFVNYMLKDGIRRDKHNLLLIGHSVSWPSSGRLVKDMPGEVPTYGDPGSDVLLVAGLNGTNQEVPSIPLGRISAFKASEVTDYLAKVKYYENETELSWRRNILHLIGGDSPGQVNEFVGIFNSVAPNVTALDGNRIITTMKNTGSTNQETALITDNVNSGVGMIAYYGHGKQTSTLYDMQYVSRATNPSYSNSKKFSFIYFNGCGVGNVFSSRLNHTLATDWLITPEKGAIAVIANSYKSYVPPTKIYLNILYKEIFLKSDQDRRTIGQILQDVANIVITGNANTGGRIMADTYEIANIHQTTLFGDPALKVLNTKSLGSLPVGFASIKAGFNADKTVDVEWSTSWEKNNSHFEILRSYNGKEFVLIGRVEGKGEASMQSNYKFRDLDPLPGLSYYKIKQVDVNSADGDGASTFSRVVSVVSSVDDEAVVFPNPSTDISIIRINDPVKLKSWKLIDIMGKLVGTGTTREVSTKALTSGQYILEIETENGDRYTKKLLRN